MHHGYCTYVKVNPFDPYFNAMSMSFLKSSYSLFFVGKTTVLKQVSDRGMELVPSSNLTRSLSLPWLIVFPAVQKFTRSNKGVEPTLNKKSNFELQYRPTETIHRESSAFRVRARIFRARRSANRVSYRVSSNAIAGGHSI